MQFGHLDLLFFDLVDFLIDGVDVDVEALLKSKGYLGVQVQLL